MQLKTLPILLATTSLLANLAGLAFAGSIEIAPQGVTEWKSVFGQVETRDRVPARARTGGTMVALDVTEGDSVSAGQRLAMIEDPKLSFQIDALDARLTSLQARLETARSELARGEQLIERGVITAQRLETLQTSVDVIDGEIAGLGSERLVIEQQIAEGEVLSPEAGIVLSVPVSLGSVVAPGEAVAVVGGGGVFLRLSVPERHAEDLAEGDTIEIGGEGEVRTGTLAKLYPQIDGGRVAADVEVEGLDPRFVGRRVPVRLPVGERMAIVVPQSALWQSGGLDFVMVEAADGAAQRVVVPGGRVMRDGEVWREILTGLHAGDVVVTGDE
ncbi:efflux RND transporter periplasmic adaptor subunit [Palleronia sp. KMU-117]|uniref:efflux RND transporter periplasmic adaptor subunit n=1 Tax=Palleronia sp. KMU-117 TaxID=3434108 RepID=UPI003D75BBB6